MRGVAGGLAGLQVRIAKLNRNVPAEMQVSGPGEAGNRSQLNGQSRNKEALEKGCRPELRLLRDRHRHRHCSAGEISCVSTRGIISGVLGPQGWSPDPVPYFNGPK